jgi:hypothetical protein
MALQNAVNVSIAYAKESTFGTPASAGSSQSIRRVSSSLSLSKESFASNEVRPDQQVSDLRHGMRSVTGGIEGELSLQTYDDWLASLLRGTWAAGTSLSQSQLTSVAASASAGTFTFGGGDPVALGLRLGDVVRFGTVNASINGRNFRIVGFGGTTNRTVTVFPKPAVDVASPVTTFTVAVQGRKLTTGVLKDSYTIEQVNPDLDNSERYVGVRMNSASISLPPNGMATVSWDMMGQDGTILSGASSPYFTAPTAAPNTGIFAGLNGSLRIAGAERAVVTALDFQVTNNLSMQGVVGSPIAPEIFFGRMVLTGNVSAYIEDTSLIDAFVAESEVDIVSQLDLAAIGGAAPDFLVFNMQRVKLSGYSKTVGPDGGVIATFPFQALLPTAGSGRDASTLVIQRANA